MEGLRMRTVSDRARRTFGAVVLCGVAMSMFAVPVQAQPAEFPDLSRFTAVAPEPYITRWFKGATEMSFLAFVTPYDIGCRFGAPKELSDSGQGVRCGGAPVGVDNIPTTDLMKREVATPKPGDCVVGAVGPGDNDAGTYQLSHYFYGGCDGTSAGPTNGGSLLAVGQKVSYGHVTCAVDTNTIVACLDTASDEHGFVLKPSGSWTF
ncbi:hypothetical protein D2E30_04220 [Mycobacteroides abscessus]|nr:hypothetical protein OUW_11514 [Mycobacteroides abscessus M93]MBL3758936.1 hypothetical protein [Mycobacteroides abscessus subsp. massiliense]NOR96866.1 hypothetical protein [Mycobacteroides abscessus]NOS16685.1 hypothetical protein [Mycobacteroides abscessus]NOS22197.1 hypothetical protein [Mycobacteroides abscessus]